MKVRVGFFGVMGWLAGSAGVELEFPDGSTCGEAMRQLGMCLGDRLPPEVWDANEEVFTPLVSIFVDGSDLEDPGQALRNGSEVLLIIPLAGG